MHEAHDREAVLRLVVANGVTSREDRAGRAHPLVGAREHLPEHLDGKLLGKRGNRERQQRAPPIAKTSLSAFVAAMAPKVVDRRRVAGRSRP